MTNLSSLKPPRDYDGQMGDVVILSSASASMAQLGWKPFTRAYIGR